jgi:hypothetical protein
LEKDNSIEKKRCDWDSDSETEVGSDLGRREQENVCALAQQLLRVRRSSVACWAENTHI